MGSQLTPLAPVKVCDAFERVLPMTGRFEGVLLLVWREILRAIYMDAEGGDTKGADGEQRGAKLYVSKVPYFQEARRLKVCTARARAARAICAAVLR